MLFRSMARKLLSIEVNVRACFRADCDARRAAFSPLNENCFPFVSLSGMLHAFKNEYRSYVVRPSNNKEEAPGVAANVEIAKEPPPAKYKQNRFFWRRF